MDRYGLIGYPLSHSFSAQFFNDKFDREKIDAKYVNFEIDDLSRFLSIVRDTAQLKGLNVTYPYKEKIMPYLDALDSSASQTGAVNVVKIERSGDVFRLVGFNTDVVGFQYSMIPYIKLVGSNALILGTGGASKAVAQALLNYGISFKYVSRIPKPGILCYKDIDQCIINTNRLIVNTTPLGMLPNCENAPEIPYEYLTDKNFLYDLIYNPPVTKFLKLGESQGSHVKNGLEMLQKQAMAAWDIWNLNNRILY